MLFNTAYTAALAFISAFITNIYFSPFYVNRVAPMLVLLTASVIIFLCLARPYKGKGNLLIKPFMTVLSFFLLLNITHNSFWAAVTILISLITARLFFKRKHYTSIVFTDSGEMVEINYTSPVNATEVLKKSHLILSPLTVLLVFLTFTYSFPHPLWEARLFPLSGYESLYAGEEVVVSGDVTECFIYDDTVMLVGDFFDITLPDGSVASPCKSAGLLPMDVITHIDSTPALTSDFITKGPTGETVTLTVNRFSEEGEVSTFTVEVTPVFSTTDNAYRMGVTYYNAPLAMTSTIQTMTFSISDKNYFAATAHSGEYLPESMEGKVIVYNATVTGHDTEGLTAQSNDPIGVLAVNTNYGTFGFLEKAEGKPMKIAKKSEVHLGKATLLSAFEGGEAKEYEVYITGTYRIDEKDVLCIAATDERIQAFGGVMRGMSGTPLLQDGKIVGALSNVDANGYHAYAIFASDMAAALFENEATISEGVTEATE